MNRTIKSYLLKVMTPLLALGAVAGIILLFGAFQRTSQPIVEQESADPLSASTVTLTIPQEVQLFGQTMSLREIENYERFDRELTSFTYGHSTTLLYFKRANRYFPAIEKVLREQGLPEDFKYLAVIESGLDPRIVSPASAAGMWQFMPATAKSYGLRISDDVDERYNIEEATRAACQYLNEAQKVYKDWFLTAAAYNAGQGRISGEMAFQDQTSFFDLLLFEETTRYLYRIAALKELFEHPARYGFALKADDLYPSINYKRVEVAKDIPNLVTFAKEQGISFADLKRHNRWLKGNSLKTAGKTFTVLIPESLHRPDTIAVHDQRWIARP